VHGRSDSGWTVRHASLRLAGGLGIETTVDDAVVDLVRALDGRPLASLLATVPPAGREDVLRVVRGLLELGLLVAVEK
jgi:hypothetical protein